MSPTLARALLVACAFNVVCAEKSVNAPPLNPSFENLQTVIDEAKANAVRDATSQIEGGGWGCEGNSKPLPSPSTSPTPSVLCPNVQLSQHDHTTCAFLFVQGLVEFSVREMWWERDMPCTSDRYLAFEWITQCAPKPHPRVIRKDDRGGPANEMGPKLWDKYRYVKDSQLRRELDRASSPQI